MKHKLLALFTLPLLLAGCSGTSSADYEHGEANIDTPRLSGDIGAFNLLTPENGYKTSKAIHFTWEEAKNAETYQIEIALDERFINGKDEVYVKEANISQPQFDFTYSLPDRNETYYWRVTAVNEDHTKMSNQVGNFYYASSNDGEINIEIEDEKDWQVHKDGAKATVSIDRDNFFNNKEETGKNSLVVSFKKEDTKIEDTSRTGWMVITNTETRELYGMDAFYFNLFYAGDDATIFIRVLDEDGEYWQYKVEVANNSKQTIVAEFADFKIRPQGPVFNNREFNHDRISYFEIVFEQTFGDGVLLLSNVRAVQFQNYSYLFLKKMNFNESDKSGWKGEHYSFPTTISKDGSELSISYVYDESKEWKGYGYQHFMVQKYFTKGNALRFKVKYTGATTKATFYMRVYEEDSDVYQFKVPYTELIEGSYKEFVVPLQAFIRYSAGGGGGRNFYFINKISFGVAGCQNLGGTLAIKDLELIDLVKDKIISSRKRVVGEDGIIDNFNNYNLYTEMYYNWIESVENKDEAIQLDVSRKAGKAENPYCGRFDYKADMYPATYYIDLDTKAVKGKNAFQIWLSDQAVKPSGSVYSYLKDEDVTADMTIQITLDTKEKYQLHIEKVAKDWTNYTIRFDDEEKFVLVNKEQFFDNEKPITSDHIVQLGFGLQYYYKDKTGKAAPTYAVSNPLYVDNIALVNADSSSIEKMLQYYIPETPEGSGIYDIDNFESYNTTDDLSPEWVNVNQTDYFELSNIVSSQGGTHSLKMHYPGVDSPSYGRYTMFSFNTKARGISFDLKGNKITKFIVNLNVGTRKQRFEVVPGDYGNSNDWYHFEIGFSKFTTPSGSDGIAINRDNAKMIDTITFGMTHINWYHDEGGYDAYVDNIKFIDDIDGEAYIHTKIS